ncbi:MAG: GNAT family N-acetyltransferase [Flavobacteriales bacterium]
MEIKVIPHYSKDYWKCVKLRDKILREPINLMFSEEELFLENDQTHVGVFENEKAIGCFSLVPVSKNEIKMRQVCVDSDLQQKGIGSKMMDYCEDWAKKNGYQEISCHARESAVNYYERHGYKTEGKLFREVSLPHMKMKKSLD